MIALLILVSAALTATVLHLTVYRKMLGALAEMERGFDEVLAGAVENSYRAVRWHARFAELSRFHDSGAVDHVMDKYPMPDWGAWEHVMEAHLRFDYPGDYEQIIEGQRAMWKAGSV